jgi:hypothetical protein
MTKPIDYGRQLIISFYADGEKRYKTKILTKQKVSQGYLITWISQSNETEACLLKTNQNGLIHFENSDDFQEARITNG